MCNRTYVSKRTIMYQKKRSGCGSKLERQVLTDVKDSEGSTLHAQQIKGLISASGEQMFMQLLWPSRPVLAVPNMSNRPSDNSAPPSPIILISSTELGRYDRPITLYVYAYLVGFMHAQIDSFQL